MANEKLQGKEQFLSKKYFSEISRFKSAPQKLTFVMAKAISKSYTQD